MDIICKCGHSVDDHGDGFCDDTACLCDNSKVAVLFTHIAKQDAVIAAARNALGCIPVYYEEYVALEVAIVSLGFQPECGHPVSAIHQEDEGTAFCTLCAKG